MLDFSTALKAEIAALEKDIRDNPDPRHRKLARLRETLAEYEPPKTPPPEANGTAKPPPLPIHPAPNLTKSSKMLIEINKMLKEKKQVHRKEILDRLVAAGIMGKEANPMQALAIFLSSHKDQFSFDGNGNYALRATS